MSSPDKGRVGAGDTDDIVGRLRHRHRSLVVADRGEAADEIERLRAALANIEMETRDGGQWTLAEVNEATRIFLAKARGETP